MNKYLLAGSFAYDTILLHSGKLESRILPEHVSNLNVAFGIHNVKDEFGGTAGNISYNSSLLKDKPLLIGVLGNDSEHYIKHLNNNELNHSTLTIFNEDKTPHAWLLTDSNNNQITSFFQGVMVNQADIPNETPDLWHISPENPRNMARMIKKAINEDKKYFFDPGQALPSLLEQTAEDIISLKDIIYHATGLFTNEYEAELLSSKLGTSINELINKDAFIVRTLGSKGSELFFNGEFIKIPVAIANNIVDPTGCGDAFRAGFIHFYLQNKPLIDCIKLGSVMGSFAIENSGGQNHKPSVEDIHHRYLKSYG